MAASSLPLPNWADLPEDMLLTVFERLSTRDLLMGASVVCRSWLRLAPGEPRLWRRVDLTDCFDPTIDMWAMACAAIDRAAGRLEHFAADRIATDDLLDYIGESRWFDIVLEELPDNYQADGIAESMPELRDLQLFANRLDNNALYDILDKCPHLESLDLRHCFNIEMSAELEAKCSKLKDVKFPNDSIKDYEYETFTETIPLDSFVFEAPILPYHEFIFDDDDNEGDGDIDEDNYGDGDSDEDNEDDMDSDEDDGDSEDDDEEH